MTSMSPSDLHSLILSLLETQAAFSTLGIAIYTFIAVRWSTLDAQTMRSTIQSPPQTEEEYHQLEKRIRKIHRRKNLAYFFLCLLSLIALIEVEVYYNLYRFASIIMHIFIGVFFISVVAAFGVLIWEGD